ncbi:MULTISPECIES: DMT family transporter [unclassified Sinorhizobium]|uniref:DMT family transporter n=1 Tax=unclassified Sinorhizobium TaxID=2613772 RepID=UPI003523D201
MSKRIQGYLYLALAMVLVGSTVIASKIIASGLPPFTATALRFAIALPIFILLMRLKGTELPKLPFRSWLILIAQAGAGSVGYTTFLISGLRLSSAADAGVIIGTLPAVSAATAVLVLGERPHRFLLMAIALAAAGVFMIALTPSNAGDHSLAGNALIFAAVICEALFILLNKRLQAELQPLALSAIMTGVGLIIAAIPAFFEAPGRDALSAEVISAIVYYALVPTVGGFLLWYAGAARVSGSEASLFTAFAPASAVTFAGLFLAEPIGTNQLIGIGCVLAAILSLAFMAPGKVRTVPSINGRHLLKEK